jgi:hypothetical protein
VQRTIKCSLVADEHGENKIHAEKEKGKGGKPKSRPGGKGGSQGDHTTAFAVLEDQLINAIDGQTITEAVSSLRATFNVYKTLPGWQKGHKNLVEYRNDVIEQILSGAENGDPAPKDLAKIANEMLSQRNKIEYTSIKPGGHGKGEGTNRGVLFDIEKTLRKKGDLSDNANYKDATKENIRAFMVNLFDSGRVSGKDKEYIANAVRQHAITITDAYPEISEHFGVTVADAEADCYEAIKNHKGGMDEKEDVVDGGGDEDVGDELNEDEEMAGAE